MAVASFGSVTAELRHGAWQEVLADVEADTLIVDTPYSPRTHSGHNDGTRDANQGTYLRRDRRSGSVYSSGRARRKSINYEPWSDKDVRAFVSHWSERISGWFVSVTDHVLAPVWAEALKEAGRYAFAPLAAVAPGRSVRLAGDGPSNWSWWTVVARPLSLSKWGTLPGAYLQGPGEAERVLMPGAKPLWLMRSLVRDYSRPGDRIVDPCAGTATTLVAALLEGRESIGAELDEETYRVGCLRLEKPHVRLRRDPPAQEGQAQLPFT